ncbi:DUF3800 domain-containing protein [Inquilinus sp. CAU 1745]|uniref:DUF3800 domain-containing protein n=1 Tax=Inquilinus sp. CAU 1745 TaxID=3140369 RepID=UPI00325BC72F
MSVQFVAYIDEAGDEGFGKLKAEASSAQSKWLVLGGILVRSNIDKNLPEWRDDIMSKFPNKKNRDIHFRHLNHAQKVVASEYLSNKQFGICCVCSNKITLLDSSQSVKIFKQKGYLYNYLTRYLLERLTWAVRDFANRTTQSTELRIVFSRRSGTDYQSMREYLILMRDGRERIRPIRSIDWTVFSPDNIKVENHSRWAGLQLADVVTSATAAGLEPNIFGNYEPRYATAFAKRFISRQRSILDCGLTLIPQIGKSPLDAQQRDFINGLCEKWQAPGP